MRRDEIIARLRAHEAELKSAGVASLSVFGSAARGDDRATSDVDVVVRLAEGAGAGGFAYFGRLGSIARRLEAILDRPVDIVAEPIRKDRLRRRVEEDRALAF